MPLRASLSQGQVIRLVLFQVGSLEDEGVFVRCLIAVDRGEGLSMMFMRRETLRARAKGSGERKARPFLSIGAKSRGRDIRDLLGKRKRFSAE